MARNETITIPAGEWTELTAGDVSAIRVQSLNGNRILLMAGSASEPVAASGAIELNSREIISANYTLADLWPGLPDATRVWAYCVYSARVSVSHA